MDLAKATRGRSRAFWRASSAASRAASSRARRSPRPSRAPPLPPADGGDPPSAAGQGRRRGPARSLLRQKGHRISPVRPSGRGRYRRRPPAVRRRPQRPRHGFPPAPQGHPPPCFSVWSCKPDCFHVLEGGAQFIHVAAKVGNDCAEHHGAAQRLQHIAWRDHQGRWRILFQPLQASQQFRQGFPFPCQRQQRLGIVGLQLVEPRRGLGELGFLLARRGREGDEPRGGFRRARMASTMRRTSAAWLCLAAASCSSSAFRSWAGSADGVAV